ncbi:hypothetical protein EAY39_20960, partial [Vibrio anguillarum]|uniref:hypothetical protein n=1 Tax=Vibrio anguillarum TaxID=55601 RepID=UPI001BE414E0
PTLKHFDNNSRLKQQYYWSDQLQNEYRWGNDGLEMGKHSLSSTLSRGNILWLLPLLGGGWEGV